MRRTGYLAKVLQRQLYNILSSKCALTLTLAALFLILLSVLQFGEVLLEWSVDKYEAQFSVYRNNIGSRSFERQLSAQLPVDVVYTWVNGSDPDLLLQLNYIKRQMAQDEKKQAKSANISKNSMYSCPFHHCVPWRTLVVSARDHINHTHLDLASWSTCMATSVSFSTLTASVTHHEPVFYLKFQEEKDVTHCLEMGLVDEEGNPVNSTRGFLTSDNTLFGAVEVPNIALAVWSSGTNHSVALDDYRQALERHHVEGILSIEVAISNRNTAIVEFQTDKLKEFLDGKLSRNITESRDDTVQVLQAHQIWMPFILPEQTENEANVEGDIISASRFEDNEELRYSIRSLVKYAPWVRHIYIVTNGQIPHWINLDNPRLTIVTHEEIFLNKSHLPTYSSPSIESHIHRIPGLSKWFLYFNDDVLLGKEVWPEDFYTPRRGQKVYLAWSVPYCAEGCPPNWINDNYCDAACNNSACEFDGVDCINKTRPGGTGGGHTWSSNTNSQGTTDICNTGCLNNWLGDRYCDAACKVHACGYDSGDCGVSDYDKLYAIEILDSTISKNYSIPLGVTAMFVNLTKIFANGTVAKATFTPSPVIRTAVMSQHHKVLTLTFTKNQTRNSSTFTVEGANAKGNKTTVRFAVTVDTATPTAQPFQTKKKGGYWHISFEEFNSTKSQDFLEQIAAKLQTAEKPINYWMTERKTVTSAPTEATKIGEIPLINLTTVSDDVLPKSTKEQLEILENEYTEGDWTDKGYVKHKYILLEPYLDALDGWRREHAAKAPLMATNASAGAPSVLRAEQDGQIVTELSQNDETVTKRELSNDKVVQDPDNDKVVQDPDNDKVVQDPDNDKVVQDPDNDKVVQDPDNDKVVQDPDNDKVVQDPDIVQGPSNDRTVEKGITKESSLQHKEELKVSKEDQPLHKQNRNRKLLSLEPEWPDWVPEKERVLAEHILKRKQKELMLSADLKQAMEDWERKHGSAETFEVDSLPWEKLHLFHKSPQGEEEKATFKTGRRLLDTFGDSLRHTNKLFNKVFGHTSRKVPAHMPHLINKDIMTELHDMFPEEFDKTSARKIRSTEDMQFAFSYFYFMMSQPKEVQEEGLFNSYDTDETGVLSARELRTLLTHTEGIPITLDSINTFKWTLGNCSKSFNGTRPQVSKEDMENLYDPGFPLINAELFLSCKPMVEKVVKMKTTNKKYNFEELSDDEVAFKMVNENVSKVVEHLDHLRREPKKFICINDNIDHTKESAHLAKLYIRDYYESILPIPSAFELPPMYRNRFLNINDLNIWQKQQQFRERLLMGALIITLALAFGSLCYGKIQQFKRTMIRWLYSHWSQSHRRRHTIALTQ